MKETGSATATALVAIVGNPNAGKTTLFNSLTGSHQKVGNYPGVTVEKVSSVLTIGDREVECVDVPGLYSLNPVSSDERVAVEVIKGTGYGARRADLLVCVVNADNLERNLFLVSQVAELGIPMVVALTMTDLLKSSGRTVDISKLSNLLGVDVVEVVGHKAKGVLELRDAIDRNLGSPRIPAPYLRPGLEQRALALKDRLARSGQEFSVQQLEGALSGKDEELVASLQDLPDLKPSFEKVAEGTAPQGAIESGSAEARYRWSATLIATVMKGDKSLYRRSRSDKIDYILTHRVFGLMVFFGVMYLTFQSIYTFAQPLMDWMGSGFDWIGDKVGAHLDGVPVLKSLVVDGIIHGVGTMLTFLPQILILFLFIAILEGTGYLARAAFLMDRLLGWCGLNGRAFIPLLSSFACAIPGIMSARVMPDAKSRLATIMVAPLMSCSARLPVYLLLIGAFIEPRFGPFWAGFTLFGMHLLGLVIAIPVVYVLNRGVIKGKRLPFLLELPPYQWPKWRDVWLTMYLRGKVFVTTAGTIIVYMSVIIWALSYFPRSDAAVRQYKAQYAVGHPRADVSEVDQFVKEKQLENSVLGTFGRTIEPVFRPAGFDWRITTSILSAFPARETVVPSLGIIFSLGEGDEKDAQYKVSLRKALSDAKWPNGKRLMNAWTAVGLMVFFALCAQCMATLATVKRETNSWKWPVFMFCYMTLLGYLGAVAVYQVGHLLGKV